MRAKSVIFSLPLRLWLKTIAWVSAEMSHRGTEWTELFLKQNNGRYGGIVSAWSSGGSLPVLLETLYPKHLSQNLSGICTLYLRRSLCRRHLRNIVFTSVPSVTPCAYYIRLLVRHSIFRKNQKNDFKENYSVLA